MATSAGEAVHTSLKTSSVREQITSLLKSPIVSSQVKPLANENDVPNLSLCPIAKKNSELHVNVDDGVSSTGDINQSLSDTFKKESTSKQSLDAFCEEVIQNSKNDTVSTNSAPKVELHHDQVKNESQSFQEELDSLEQLAMVRVHKGDRKLVEPKSLDVMKLECNFTKEMQTIATNTAVHAVKHNINCHLSGELLNSSLVENPKKEPVGNAETSTELGSSVSNLPTKECSDFNKETSLSNMSLNCGKISKESCDTAHFVSNYNSSDTLTNTHTRYTKGLDNLSLCEINNVQRSENEKNENFLEKEIVAASTKVSNVSKGGNNLNIPSTNLSNKLYNLPNEVDCDFQSSLLSSVDQKFPNTSDRCKDSRAHIDELKNYETDEDDLKVLEAFIVNSATNPEIAVCSNNGIQVNATKYSLESSLLDDLTKNDNEMGSNIEVLEENRESIIQINKESTSGNTSPIQGTPLSITTHTNPFGIQSNESCAILDSTSLNASKCKTNSSIRRQSKQKSVRCIGKFLPLKKRFSSRKLINSDDYVSVESEEHKSFSGEVSIAKRDKRRPVCTCKKSKYESDISGMKSGRKTHFGIQKYSVNDSVCKCFVMVQDDKLMTSHSSANMHAKEELLHPQPHIQSVKYSKKKSSLKNDLHNKYMGRFSVCHCISTDHDVGKERQMDYLLNYSSVKTRKTRPQKRVGDCAGLFTSRTLKQEACSSVSSRYLSNINRYLSPTPNTPRHKIAKKLSENMKTPSHKQNIAEYKVKRGFTTKNLEYSTPIISVSWCTELTYEILKSKAKEIILPSPLWSVLVDMDRNFIVFLRTVSDLSESYKVYDKAMVFQGSLEPIAFIFNEIINLPIPSLQTYEDVILLIENFHHLPLCEGTGIRQRPRSKYCYKYKDVWNTEFRCSQCLEERRRVLSCYVRKLKEKILLLEKL